MIFLLTSKKRPLAAGGAVTPPPPLPPTQTGETRILTYKGKAITKNNKALTVII